MIYTYKAKVIKVVDGDTIDVNIDLGFHFEHKDQRIRLFGLNAPEVRGKERAAGIESKLWLKSQIEDKEIELVSIKHKKGKYGRWLGIIKLGTRNLNQEMIDQGLAEAVSYN